jgi:hypothetical protein
MKAFAIDRIRVTHCKPTSYIMPNGMPIMLSRNFSGLVLLLNTNPKGNFFSLRFQSQLMSEVPSSIKSVSMPPEVLPYCDIAL